MAVRPYSGRRFRWVAARFVGAFAAVSLDALFLAAPLAAQAPTSETRPTLTGELRRFADASVEVSVFARDLADLPETLWSRVRSAGAVSFLPGGASEANDEARRQLDSRLGSGTVTTVTGASALAPLGVQVRGVDEVRVAWFGRTESEGVLILADAQAADPTFSLRIVIPDPTGTEQDWWGLQAALSQAGIRRVQIVSGTP